MAAALVVPGPDRGAAAGLQKDAVQGGRRAGCVGSVLTVTCVVFCVCLGLLEMFHLRQTAELRCQLLGLQQRLLDLEAALPTELLVPVGYQRRRRSVAGTSQQKNAAGIPIVDRPYGYRPGLHEHAQGMRVYESFGSPTKKPDGGSILPHHRSSAAYHGSKLGRVNTKAAEAAAAAAPPPRPLTQRPTSTAHSGVHHRRSRVHQESKTIAKSRRGRRRRVTRKRLPGKRVKSRKAAEARGAPTGYSAKPTEIASNIRQPASLGASSGHRSSGSSTGASAGRQTGSSGGSRRNRRLMRMMEELREAMGTTAAHLEGHTTNYSLDHPHYGGNGLLRNIQPDALFADWQFAPWVHRHGYSRDFRLRGGAVTVTKPGVYFLYAQVNYLDDSDINGFEIVVSGRSFAKCLTMEASDHRQKANTCHTSGVTYLDSGDTVSVRDLERMRVSMFLPDRSFFGLVRLAGTGGDSGDWKHSRRESGWST